tara:strand:- start:2280 stop:3596 length:1317 start_codon:yes stop_codon:yes gene_type:complete
MKKVFFAMMLLCNWAVAQNSVEEEPKGTIGINSQFSYKMLDPSQNLRKVNILLEERQKGALKDRSLTIGTSLISIFDYQRSNEDSKFAYLMRHPTSSNQIGKTVTEAVIHSFQISSTGAINNWITVHAELLYNPEQSFGAGTITTLTRNQIQLYKAFLVLGDLNKSPVYGAIGKMDAPFGQVGSVSPFSNSTTWHAFGGLGYGLQVGYRKGGLHAKFMAVQGGSQFRALATPVGNGSNVPSKINNFVSDVNYTMNLTKETKLNVGGSFVFGSAYCHAYPVTHFNPCQDNNPAYAAYGNLKVSHKFVLQGSFAKTLKVWPGTFNPNPPLDAFPASKVSAFDIGAKYNFNPESNVVYTVSGEFSKYIAGPEGAPWERQNQFVLGFAGMINRSCKLFFEAFRTDGYVPLNFVSGGNLAPGETHSVRGSFSHGVVLGGQVIL